MPRVLLVFEPPDGGVAVNVEQLALGLGARGWEVEVAGPRDAVIYPRLATAGVRVHRVALARGYGRPWGDLAALGALVRLLRRGRYDLVHCHSSKAGAVGRPAAALAGVPAVYTPHCYAFMMEAPLAVGHATAAIERALGPLTARTICVCEAERAAARRWRVGPRGRLRVVLNGCPPCDAVEPDPALAALRGEGPLAAAVTVLRRQKRVDLFLRAIPLALERVPGARFAVVGGGPLEGELRALASELGVDVAFLPFRAPAARYLRALDVLVLPSDWEALSIGLLEALACGVPQVATDVGGTAEVVAADTGVLVAPGDERALADAMASLLAQSERRAALAAGSRRRYAERFTLERMLDETAAVYAEAFSAPVRPLSGTR